MEAISREEKKKPGPSTYKISAKGNYLAFEDRGGVNNGIPKSGTDQM